MSKANSKKIRIISLIFVFAFLTQLFFSAFALEELMQQDSYRNFLINLAKDDQAYPDSEIVINGGDFVLADEAAGAQKLDEFEGRTNVLHWSNIGGEVEWEFTVDQPGLYMARMSYYVLKDESRNVELEMYIDGETQYSSMGRLTFPRLFVDDLKVNSDGEKVIERDVRNNDMRPKQIPLKSWLDEPVSDKDGLYNEPFYFNLTEGTHKLKFVGIRAGVAIERITFYNEKKLPSYAEYSKGATLANAYETTIQGEKPLYKSDSVMYPVYDRTGPDTQPSDPVKLRLNTIGQWNWNMHGQYLVYEFEVPEDGYYKIGLRYRQNLVRGLTSYRRLYIERDGKFEVPFEEANAIPFRFDEKWKKAVIGQDSNGEGGYLFKFNKGKNRIRLEVVPGPAGALIAELENTAYLMNMYYRKMIMITSVNPDPYRDYMLFDEIPELETIFETIRDQALDSYNKIIELNNGKTSADSAILKNIAVQMDSFLDKRDTVAVRVQRLKDNTSSLSNLIMTLKNQPVEIDYIVISSKEKDVLPKDSGFFSKLAFSFKSFIGSFTEDYNSIGKVVSEKEGKRLVNVWINMGRDQTQVIKTLVDSDFTPKSGVVVNLSLVQQSLIQATLSNRGPDVVLFVPTGEPVNLAARGALIDLKQFPNYDEVVKRFNPQAIVPYQYNGGVYGMPLTQNFQMMFYRTDIFEELNLQPPKTWDDFYKVIKVLQSNNMTAGIPNMPPDSQMQTNNSIFAMFMKNRGVDYYNQELSKTNFDTREAIEAFKQWTGLYSKYGLPYQFDFYNRFRTGEMPIGLNSYVLFNMLSIGAPEIKGLWEMAPIPGIEKDGKIVNNVFASGTCAVMLSRARDPEAAWEFIDYFTSAEAQAGFGIEIETILGPSARYDTANLEAFTKLPWSAKEQKLISQEWNNIFELPQVIAAYYVERNLTNAFRKVVFADANPREVLLDYNKEINREIKRKRIEFNLEKEDGRD